MEKRALARMAAALFRLACVAFPKRIRAPLGAEMTETFERAVAAEFGRRGRLAALWLALRALGDAVRRGLEERTRSEVPDGHGREPSGRPGARAFQDLATDARLALRALARAPGFAAAATVILALGIGANATVLTALRATILTPAPYPDPDRLVLVDIARTNLTTGESSAMTWSYPKLRFLTQAQGRLIDPLAGYAPRTATLVESGLPTRINIEVVSAGYFGVLGVDPVLGREFDRDEDDAATPALVVMLSHELWRTRFAADPAILGRAIDLNAKALTVVGVAPAGFRGLTGEAAVWIPAGSSGVVVSPFMVVDVQSHWMHAVGRLREGASFEEARDQMESLGQAVAETYPISSNRTYAYGGSARRFEDVRVNPGARSAVLVLSVAALLVLLVACANLSGLLVTRARRRGHDSAVRLAVGASRWRLVRASLTESALLAGAGGGAGLALAVVGTRAMALAWPRQFQSSSGGEMRVVSGDALAVDGTVLAVGMGVTMVIAILLGVLPVWRASRSDLAPRLKEGARAGRRTGRVHGADARAVLVGGQVALAMVLLVGTGLVGTSVRRLLAVDLGFDHDRIVTFQYTLPQESGWAADPAVFHHTVLDRLGALPGVEGVALGVPPLGGHWSLTYVKGIAGRPPIPSGEEPTIGVNIVTPGYMEMLGIPVLEGRELDATDGLDAVPAVVLSRLAADKLFAGEPAIGQRVELGIREDGKERLSEVVGVVGDALYTPPDREPLPEAYYALRDFPVTSATISLRAAGDPARLMPAVREAMLELEPTMPIANVQMMDDVIMRATGDRRVVLVLLSLFALVTVLLAATGTWGIVSHAVTDRQRELGLRLALGAGNARVVRLVLGQSVRAAVIGAAVGTLVAAAGSRLLESFLYDTSRVDPVAFATSVALLLAVVHVATWVPARAATRVDPMQALRSD